MKKGFTLIELLIVISIIGILLAISIFGLKGAREAARDAKRKSDLQNIASGLEIYKSDCNVYPLTASVNLNAVSALAGSGSPAASCPAGNVYLTGAIKDPISPTSNYSYSSPTGTGYSLCATLEQAPNPVMDVSTCATCTSFCNYIVTNP